MKLWRRLFRDTEGNVLMLTGFCILALIALAGAGVDVGRYAMVKLRLQQAIDASAIALATLPNTASAADRQNELVQYFSLNYSDKNGTDSYLGVNVAPGNLAVSPPDSPYITVGVNTTIPTVFMKFVGVKNIPISAANKVLKTSTSTGSTYDIILVMDNSASMTTKDAGGGVSRIQALKNTATSFSNYLLGLPGNQIGAVKWDSKFEGSTPLTNNLTTITSFLSGMNATGVSTGSQFGLTPAYTMGGTFNPKSTHAIILLTDGENNTPNQNTSDSQSLAVCNQFKAMSPETLVYTIAFGGDIIKNNAVYKTAQKFLSDCATTKAGIPVATGYTVLTAQPNEGSFFFIAPNQAALQGVFNSILNTVTKIRLTQ